MRASVGTNGRVSAGAKRLAKERGIMVWAADELARLLGEHPCSLADVEAMNNRRLASMRDVPARINASIMNRQV